MNKPTKEYAMIKTCTILNHFNIFCCSFHIIIYIFFYIFTSNITQDYFIQGNNYNFYGKNNTHKLALCISHIFSTDAVFY